ncbi:MAG TPA: GMC family oxidoreductase [Solirubrobacteraceae bacterium]|jgi:choline dehydrogenase-like flavoprotein|nr:GMC family oxidoreductase [Solirubrobacteraceae bacterium]
MTTRQYVPPSRESARGADDEFQRRAVAVSDPADVEGQLTPPECLLRTVLRVLAVLFALFAPVFLLATLAVPGHAGWAQVGFSVNSVTKVGVLAGLCAIASADLRRFEMLVPLVILAHALSVLAIAIVLFGADTSAPFDVLGTHISLTGVLIGALVMDGGIGALLTVLYVRARKARFQLDYLPAIAFEALAALADVIVVRGEEEILPADVARNVDRYMASFEAQRKWVIPVALCGLWLYPLLLLRAPFALIAPPQRRAFVERHFLRDVARRRIPLVREYVEAMIRLSQQMVFLGYYGDERTFASVGYQPFSKRARYSSAVAAKAMPHPPLDTLGKDDIGGDTIDADVVVVGSGAAGSVIAYRMAEAGRRVLVLEGGRHVDPGEFTEDEVHQLTQLYGDGALQQSRDFSFQVLQGKCVGGSTVVNNAVCFDLPGGVLEHWNGALDAGLDAAALGASFAEMRAFLGVQTPPSEFPEGGAGMFLKGARALGLDAPPWKLAAVDANIRDCPGSGYCNIGCPFANKLSMLVTVLPKAQQEFGKDALQILPECLVRKIEHKQGHARAVVAELGGRRLRVRANTVVVSGGAIASPWLLMQSGIARGRAGRRLAFNMGSPVTAVFGKELDSFDGVQISHYLEPPADHGYVIETWFNPVVSQALNMPGWLDDHWRNMHRFRRLTAAGVLVGTTTEQARLRRALTGGPDIDYTPGRGDPRNVDDMKRLVEGLKLLGRVFLAAGAERVMVNTFEYHEFTQARELDKLERYVRDASDLSVGTGHPQGGNAIGVDPQRSVVGPDCRVHGFENLYVCDASVFPSATTVNPQLTVMALANMVAAGIPEA